MKIVRSFTLLSMIVFLSTNVSLVSKNKVTRGHVNTLDAQTELQEVTEYDGIVIIDFYAEWCGPCQRLKPVLKKIAEQYSDVLIVAVNTEKHRSASKEHRVRSIPTLLFFKDGRLVQREVGFVSEKEIQKIIKKLQA